MTPARDRVRPLTCTLWVAVCTVAIAACGASTPHTLSHPAHRTTHTTTADERTVTVNIGTGSIPKYLRERERPIGTGVRFHPPVYGAPTGTCLTTFKPRYEAHIEVFGANKVVLLPAGIGTGGPRTLLDGQLTKAVCFGNVVTLNPTGTVYVRPHSGVTLTTLFKAWGEPLTTTRVASFRSAHRVRLFVNGKPYRGIPGKLRITPDAEIVIESGPYVPPHTSFAYPPIPQVS